MFIILKYILEFINVLFIFRSSFALVNWSNKNSLLGTNATKPPKLTLNPPFTALRIYPFTIVLDFFKITGKLKGHFL